MKIDEHIEYWLKSADHDLDTAESLFSAGKYDWCLFLEEMYLMLLQILVDKILVGECRRTV